MTRQPDIRPYRGKHPEIAKSAYIDPASVVIGDVVIGEDAAAAKSLYAVAHAVIARLSELGSSTLGPSVQID